MNTKHNKTIKILVSICLIILIGILIKQFALITLVNNALISNKPSNKYSYYLSPSESILEALDLQTISMQENKETYKYGTHIYSIENESNYIEFFVSGDKYTSWLFVLDKKYENGVAKYRVSHLENHIELKRLETKNIIDDYCFIVLENKKDIKKYESLSPIVTEFKIYTKQGIETLYLLVLKGV